MGGVIGGITQKMENSGEKKAQTKAEAFHQALKDKLGRKEAEAKAAADAFNASFDGQLRQLSSGFNDLLTEIGKQMLARQRGNIVNVASIAGLHGVIDRSAYNASKHGLVGLTRTLAAEWGSRGVRVNAVCPGWIKTEMDEADQGSGAYSDSDIINRVPMGRFAKPEDVARAIAFLAHEDSFINGVSLPVDGGWIADASWDALRVKKR
jgi:NAD(P)-dependent dehydrogenase (short-subunit alcohol dehydrogenase family)